MNLSVQNFDNFQFFMVLQISKLPTLELGAARVHSKYADLISDIRGFYELSNLRSTGGVLHASHI